MSRPLRLEFPGAFWHVTSRGNERREVFRDDADREGFLGILGRTIDLFRWHLHAFVLMGNHYHLLVETPDPTLSRGMRELNGVYTQLFNRRHGRTGHLFQGRFKAIAVERDSHLLELARYIVLNPVRAGLVRMVKDWRWSSYRATAGLEQPPPWLETAFTLLQFARRRAEATNRYRLFVSEGSRSGYEPWKQLRGQIYLGSDQFLEDMERRATSAGGAHGIARPQLHPTGPDDGGRLLKRCLATLELTEEEFLRRTRLLAAERKAVALVLRLKGLLRHQAIGELLGVGESQASALVSQGEAALRERGDLKRKLASALGSTRST